MNQSIKYRKMGKRKSVRHFKEGRRGRDRMIVGFTTTCANSAYDH